jgi:hypothetical protein
VDEKRRILIVTFLGSSRLNPEKSMKEQEGRERQELGSGNGFELGRALEASTVPEFSSCFSL